MRGYSLVVVFALICGCAPPQSAVKPSVSATQEKPGSKEVFIAFDQAGKNVKAKSFSTGKELLGEVQRLGGARGEYETDSAFLSRLSALGNYSVNGEITASDVKFDRSTGVFSLRVSMRDAQGYGFKSDLGALKAVNTDYPSFYLGEDIYSRGQYTGQNSFGATAIIEKRKIDRYYLVFNPVPKSPGNIFFYNVTGKLGLSAAEMESQRDNIRVLFTVMPAPSYVQFVRRYQEPTIANPYESEINNYFFQAKVFWVRVVNIKTGKVYDDEARMSIEAL
ncbi:hypothetical protein [Pseudomonas chlororaphis]|uniref:hypothetical protein n=1 Tax=Pseudomonas chlororaphis TaxID=587753 RepID=UPI0024083A94|nr:hypothetical protein [Pseudomonas chlororaphis]